MDIVEYNPVGPRLLEFRSQETYFFVPPGFRENMFFIGMQKQMDELDAKLSDPRRRQTGTSSVVLHGAPGAGKSHLARQYIYTHRSKFKGGVFWLNARSFEEMEKDLEEIAQRYVASDAPDIRIQPVTEGRKLLSAVTEWFSVREDWLIVLDGVVIDTREDAEVLQQVIPDRPGASLIYTSRSSQFHASHRLMHPHPIKIPPLSGRNGTDLLFQETGLERTRSREDAAISIVKKVGGLPLAIHAVSLRLAQTRERLETYKLRSYADDPKLGGVYNDIIEALFLNHRAAYNLINILAFFGPHVPVELLRMGIKGLRSFGFVVKSASGYSAAPEINNSLTILMRNALLERNEADDGDSTVSSRGSVNEPETPLTPESMDLLRLHALVQKFCRDRLERGDDRQNGLSEWLRVASRVLTQSYAAAKNKLAEVEEDHQHPRITDYYAYRVHVKRIQEHSVAYENKSRSFQDIRSKLDATLSDVEAEIGKYEQRSLVSSISIGDVVPSIFDRASTTSSSSQMTEDGPATPDQDAAPTPWQPNWGIGVDEPIQTSPTFQKSVGNESPSVGLYPSSHGSYRTAVEMLRTLSDQTARQDPTTPEEYTSEGYTPEGYMPEVFTPAPEALHTRANSQSVFQGSVNTGNTMPSVGLPDTKILAQGEFARDVYPASAGALPHLARVHRASPQGSGFRPPSLSPAASAWPDEKYPEGNPTSPMGPFLSRMPSSPMPAPPILTQGSPNPMAAPFYPRAHKQPDPYTSTPSAVPLRFGEPWSPFEPPVQPTQFGWEMNQEWSQQAAPATLSYSDVFRRVGQGYPAAAGNFQPTAFGGNVPYSLSGRIHGTEAGAVFPGYVGAQSGWRHGRASSVPSIDAQNPAFAYSDALRRASAVSSPAGWVSGGQYSPPYMARQTSMQSNSSGEARLVVPPSSAPPYMFPFARPMYSGPGPQATTSPPHAPATPAQLGLRTSPLQAVQAADDLPAIQSPMAHEGTAGIMTPHAGQVVPSLPYGQPPGYVIPSRTRSPASGAMVPPPASAFAGSASPMASAAQSRPHSALLPATFIDSPASTSPPTAQAMSRAGSGPGIVVSDPGRGLGIAEFGGPGGNAAETGTVTFGEHPPVNVSDARRRSFLYGERLREEQRRKADGQASPGSRTQRRESSPRWGAQSELLPPQSSAWDLPPAQYADVMPTISGPAPYPDLNTMPAQTDAEQLKSMVEQASPVPQDPGAISERSRNGRARGNSEPQKDSWLRSAALGRR